MGGGGGCQIATLSSIGEGQHFQILEICDLHSFVSTHLSMSVVTWSLFHEIKLTRTNYSIILDRFILCRKWVDLFPFAGSTKWSKGLPSLSYQIQVHVFGHLVMKTLQIEFFFIRCLSCPIVWQSKYTTETELYCQMTKLLTSILQSSCEKSGLFSKDGGQGTTCL